MAAPRRSAIILADVHVVDVALGPSGLQGGNRVFFFDIGVESIIKNAEAGFVQPIKIGGGLLAGVEQIAFKAVERLQRADQTGIARLLCDLTVNAGAAIQFGVGRPLA